MPADEPVQDRVVVPEPPVIELDVKEQDALVELVVTARVTVPMNPLTGVTAIVNVPAKPTFTVILTGLAETTKLWTW